MDALDERPRAGARLSHGLLIGGNATLVVVPVGHAHVHLLHVAGLSLRRDGARDDDHEDQG